MVDQTYIYIFFNLTTPYLLLQEDQFAELQRRVCILENRAPGDGEEGRLRDRIETLLKEKEQDRTKIQLYHTQIQMLTEDFEQEREDRSRQHQRAEEISHQKATLELQIHALKQENSRLITAQRRVTSIANYSRYTSSRRSEPRYACDDGSNQPLEPNRDTVDSHN